MSRSLAIEPNIQSTKRAAEQADKERTPEQIRTRAYKIYEARGCVDGHHEDDWYQAEKELLGRDAVNRAA
jgi:hypothetical protein